MEIPPTFVNQLSVIGNQGKVIGDRLSVKRSPIYYILQVDTTPGFNTPIVDTTDITHDTLTLRENLYYWRVKAYDSAGNEGDFSEPWWFGIDTQSPQISNTTAWTDTGFAGPFFVYSTIIDNIEIGKAELWYKTSVDTNWVYVEMDTTETSDQYVGEIPSQPDSTKVWYYILAKDIAMPPNEAKDPENAPDSSYSFIAGYVGIEEIDSEMPKTFSVSQNYPNPFINQTKIHYGLPKDTYIRITIYDIMGREIVTLADEYKKAGYYTITWNGTNKSGRKVASGIYFYRVETDEKKIVKKAYLLR